MTVISGKDYLKLFDCFPLQHQRQKDMDGLTYMLEYIERETIVLSVHPKPEQLIFDLREGI